VRFVFTPPVWHERPFLSIAVARNGLRNFKCHSLPSPLFPPNRAKVVKWIKTLKPDNDTAPEDALERALKLQPQVIYFLTDGEIPSTTPDTVKKFNHAHKTVIHTIAFGTEEGAEMLRAIAQDNGGKYQFVR